MIFKDSQGVLTPLGLTTPVNLRLFVELSEFVKSFRATLNTGDGIEVARNISAIISLAGLEQGEGNLLWVVESFVLLMVHIDELYASMPPIFSNKIPTPPDTGNSDQPWDYPERVQLHTWIHIIAYNYKWSRSEILNLHPVEAARLIQEIEIDKTFQREFEHSLSEVAYSHDAKSKSTRYHALKRPLWMVGVVKMPPKIKIPKIAMPVGVVYDAQYFIEKMEKAALLRNGQKT